jgi:hypothetical protein
MNIAFRHGPIPDAGFFDDAEQGFGAAITGITRSW